MGLILNYILFGLLGIFIIHIIAMYKMTSDREEIVTYNIEDGILFVMCFLGHGYLIYKEGLSSLGLYILGANIIVIALLIFASQLVDYLEPSVWHLVAMLHLIGALMLHRLSPELALRHILYGGLGFLIMLAFTIIMTKVTFLDRLTWLYLILSIGLLLISNYTMNGATNWFKIGLLSFQPSELVKILYVFSLAILFKSRNSWKRLLLGSAYSALLILILVFQRDLGSALLFFALYMVLSYMYTRKRWISFLQAGAFIVACFLAYRIFSHVRTRVLAWQDPFAYIDTKGYQITQALFSLAAGRWMGTGLYDGMPKKVPVVTSDFIFAAIGEEFGSLFAILLVVVYCLLILFLLTQTQKNKQLFKAYVAAGITVMMGFQGFLIIGGVTKMIPLTGVTLPFVSAGGTSLVVSFLMVGIVDAISKMRDKEEERQYRFHTMITLKYILSFMFLSVILYFTYFIAVDSLETELNSYNARLDDIEDNIQRGSIYDAQGNVLAYSELTEDGTYERVYPYKNEFAHAVGYSQMGKTGIEADLNVELLSGHRSLLNRFLQFVTDYDAPQKGSDVHLTLNNTLQEIAYDSLGNQKGAVVAMDPSTGKILAMVSKPDFDPNDIESIYSDLLQDTDDAPLVNRVTNGLYPPGSTFKILTALTYIEEFGEDFSYTCTGVDEFSGTYIHCYGNTAHGQENLEEAFANSCNTAFATIGTKINLDDLQELGETLLFNKELPYPYQTATSSLDLSESSTSGEMRAQSVIGQGETLITPLHNLLISCTIANGGVLMKPYLVDYLTNADGDIYDKTIPESYDTLLTTDQTQIMKEYMEDVVEEGTGQGLKSDSYTAAGKTGSAENPFGDTHAWFVGYAPVDNPQIAVAIIVENAGTSSANAIPIAKKMFDAYLVDEK